MFAFPRGQFSFVPTVDRYGLGGRRKIIPQVFDDQRTGTSDERMREANTRALPTRQPSF
jgi:hypothetical protein